MGPLKHPFTAVVSAPTKAGKTEWVKNLVLNAEKMISPTPQLIYWSYSEWQPAYSELQSSNADIHFCQGFPDLGELKANLEVPKFLILDDQMQEMKRDKRLVQLFTKGSHHYNISVIHIVQNLFFEGM